ncbi:MAG TPA: N-acetyl-gamma-glutamyl-phosphate reductase [Acidimicrobiia bacterium]|nr:N-acetyl-gamma-glutamyl-phosphate reductase [Acidimicrobiia bacterium]
MVNQKLSVNIVGASGYVGADLLRIVLGHPNFELKDIFAFSKANIEIGELFPNLQFLLPGKKLLSSEDAPIDNCDLLFLALPHTQSQEVMLNLKNENVRVVDLSADFRFEDTGIFETWYLTPHLNKEKQADFIYGLPEFHRESLRTAQYIASPGCYPTAAILGAKPFLDEGLLSGASIIVNGASGVSGAGATATDATIFSQVDGNFKAYGLIDHRHTPEMSKELGVEVLFTPHLVPMSRGILTTTYIPCETKLSHKDLNSIYAKKYDDEPFVFVSDAPPQTKQVTGTNNCIVSAFYDERTKHIVALSAIDNLVKGSAGQAIQAANISIDIGETTGLESIALYP